MRLNKNKCVIRKGTKLLNDAHGDLHKEYNFEDVCGKKKMKRKSKQEKDERMETRINYFKKRRKKKVQKLFSCEREYSFTTFLVSYSAKRER